MTEHASLFSGIGGFDLAAEWSNWNNAFHCEWEDFPRRLLKYYWPNAISYGDIKQTDFTIHRGEIDILSGGFPCQSFSVAGNRKGTNDNRYLWPEMLRAIREIQPTFVVGENVTGILSMAEREVFARVDSRSLVRYEDFDQYEAVYTRQIKLLVPRICQELEAEGYEVQVFAIPAAGVGAPHRRERIWFVAFNSERKPYGGHNPMSSISSRMEMEPNTLEKIGRSKSSNFDQSSINDGNASNPKLYGCTSTQRRRSNDENCQRITEGKKITEQFERIREPGKLESVQQNVTNSCIKSLQRLENQGRSRKSGEEREKQSTRYVFPNWKNFPTQPPVCGGNDGLPTELDGITLSNWRNESIKGYGNAVVPQVVYQIFAAIDEFLKSNSK